MFSEVRLSVKAAAFAVIPVAFAVIPLARSMPASAAADTTAVLITNVATGFCLEANDTRVYTSGCNGSSGQQWSLSGTTLKNMVTEFCLEANDSKEVQTSNCVSGSSYQKWVRGSGTTLRNLGTGFCLGSRANEVYVDQCDDSRNQKWGGI